MKFCGCTISVAATIDDHFVLRFDGVTALDFPVYAKATHEVVEMVLEAMDKYGMIDKANVTLEQMCYIVLMVGGILDFIWCDHVDVAPTG